MLSLFFGNGKQTSASSSREILNREGGIKKEKKTSEKKKTRHSSLGRSSWPSEQKKTREKRREEEKTFLLWQKQVVFLYDNTLLFWQERLLSENAANILVFHRKKMRGVLRKKPPFSPELKYSSMRKILYSQRRTNIGLLRKRKKTPLFQKTGLLWWKKVFISGRQANCFLITSGCRRPSSSRGTRPIAVGRRPQRQNSRPWPELPPEMTSSPCRNSFELWPYLNISTCCKAFMCQGQPLES